MPAFHLEQLRVPHRTRTRGDSWLWREWCFACVVLRHFYIRFLVIVGILFIGGLLFRLFEPDKQHSLLEAMYYTWSLIFGEPPEAFPQQSYVLQLLFFIVPILGLTVILEAILDFALMVRDRRRSERSWCLTMAASFSDHIVLIGLGRLGYRTFKLLRKLGEPVVVVERDPQNQFLDEVRRDGAPLFICDARREAILEDANITKARSVICAADDDLANLEIALDARRMAPNVRVVLRLFDQNMADKIRDGFNIHLAMSPSALSAPTFAMSAVDPSILSTLVVGDQLVVMQRWFVRDNGPLCNKTVADVLIKYGFSIVERRPQTGPPALFPTPTTRLATADELLVQGPYQALVDLRKKEITPT